MPTPRALPRARRLAVPALAAVLLAGPLAVGSGAVDSGAVGSGAVAPRVAAPPSPSVQAPLFTPGVAARTAHDHAAHDHAAHDHAAHDHAAGPSGRRPAPRLGAVNAASGFRALAVRTPGDADHSDPAPAGVDVTEPVSTEQLRAAAGVGATPGSLLQAGTPGSRYLTRHVTPFCAGTGTEGKRVQAVYAVAEGAPDRYADVLPVLRNELANIDDMFALSARQTGGGRLVRWVTGADCLPSVLRVVLPSSALGPSITGTRDALVARGMSDPSRKYLIFADADEMCGQGGTWVDSRPTGNANDLRTGYARVDTACWAMPHGGHSIAGHELLHTLGSVQEDAPNATSYGHCTDDAEVMCYRDGSPQQVRPDVCPLWHEELLDCGKDDYFSTAPAAGSYLATHWNTARSSWLATVPPLPDGPAVTAAADRTRVQSGEVLTLTAASPEAGTSFAWERTVGPCGFVRSNTGATVQVSCVHSSTPQTQTFLVRGVRSGDGTAGVAEVAVAYAPTGEQPSPAPTAPAPTPVVTPPVVTPPSAPPAPVAPPALPDDAPPFVSLSPAVISAGERVTVTYRGLPGTTLQVLSRTQPSTAFTPIATVLLDTSGRGTTTHAPQKNTRLAAVSATGVPSSTQPLVEVRSVASMTPRRVDARTYALTGRVYPARPGRLVSLYRDGVLTARTTTSATGIYALNTRQPAGTWTFQVRTTSDTWNVGAAGPARRLPVV